MNANIAKIDSAGRLSMSAQHRKALGLEGGGPVVVSTHPTRTALRDDGRMVDLMGLRLA